MWQDSYGNQPARPVDEAVAEYLDAYRDRIQAQLHHRRTTPAALRRIDDVHLPALAAAKFPDDPVTREAVIRGQLNVTEAAIARN